MLDRQARAQHVFPGCVPFVGTGASRSKGAAFAGSVLGIVGRRVS